MDLIISIVIPFVATFAGVFLAYYLAARQERHKREDEEAQTRSNVRALLATELRAIKDNLDGAVKLREENIHFIPNVDLPIDAKESAVNSGQFSLLNAELQLEISHIYAVIERAQDFLHQMREFVASSALALMNRDRVFQRIANNFWGQVQHLRENIPNLVNKLGRPD